MAIDPVLAEQMDTAAKAFEKELMELMQTKRPTENYEEVVRALAELWKKHYLQAGHKRLGQKLLAILK